MLARQRLEFERSLEAERIVGRHLSDTIDSPREALDHARDQLTRERRAYHEPAHTRDPYVRFAMAVAAITMFVCLVTALYFRV